MAGDRQGNTGSRYHGSRNASRGTESGTEALSDVPPWERAPVVPAASEPGEDVNYSITVHRSMGKGWRYRIAMRNPKAGRLWMPVESGTGTRDECIDKVLTVIRNRASEGR